MIEAMLSRIGEVQQRTTVRTVFGDAYQVDGRTLIPVAGVAYGFGFGGARANGKGPNGAEPPVEAGRALDRRVSMAGAAEPDAASDGGGGGAGVIVRPVAVLEISGGETKVRPIVDVTRLAIAGMVLAAWSVFWITYTVRRTAAWR
jgi:uncharacterized spore protein YtfJ